MQLIYGSKAGQKKPHTPRISDDTVASITKITALYLLGEGEIRGLVNGSKSIYFEDTPLEDDNGHRNFENVEWEIRHGTVDQTHIPGVPSASTEQIINTELRSGTPWTRLISDTQLSSINVNVSWPRLSKMEDNGDVNGTTVDYAIDVRTDGGAWVTMVSKSLTAKTSGRYQRTHNIPLPDANNNWQVRVRKITEDGDNERLFNQMHIDSIAEIIDAKLCYPHSAVIKLTWDSRAFGNTPKVSFETYGRYVKVPVNYDAETRKSTGIWTGEFKEAFTTNPAWIYYDLITNDRYGLGNKLKPYMIHKWAIEHIAKICDVMVDDGKGGLEPRYTCNLYLQTAETAFDVLQHIAGIFRGMAFWNGSQIILDADTYKDCDYVITRANVINGEFVKTGTAANERHTIAKVGYSNPDNNYEVDYVFVRNERAIAEIGINILDLSAIACTSEGEAYRFGLAALLTEQNRTQTVSFTMGLDGALPSVGDRIDIPDIMFTGHNTGGRISGVNKDRTIITVDRDNVPVALGDKLVVNLESGKAQTREILSINGREITVSKPFDAVSRENVWAVSSDELPTMSFIVLSVRANEDGTQYNYTALQYDATLQQQIDNGTIIENKPPLPPLVSMIIDAPQSIALSTRHRIEQAQTITTLVITWEQVKDAVAYDVEWRKDDGDWISVPRTGNISVEVDGVYSGNYIARVRAVSAFDAVSKPITSTLTKVEGKAGKPPSLLSLKATGTLFGMELNWSFAKGSGDAAYTEIQVASAPDTNVALLGQYSYPTNNAKLNGLQSGLVQYYRGRIVDKLGFKGDWSNWARGEVLNDSSQVLDLIAGDIEQSHLHQELTDKINLVSKIAPIDQRITKEVQERIKALGEIKDGYDQRFISVDSSISDAQRAAQAASEAASAAQSAADEADRKAKVTQGQVDDISADGKLTPVEKKQAKLIVDDIKQVDTDIKARAAKYSVSTAEYDKAYKALVTNYVNSLLANLNTTSSIDRSEFNSKFNALFTKRAELDTAITVAAKKVADDAQKAAEAAQGAAEDAARAAGEAAGAASAAKSAADEADRKAVVAQGQVNDISADGKLTPVEKKQANLIWSEIAKTDTEVRANAAKYKVGFTAYSSAYSALDAYLKGLTTGAAANTTSIIDRSAFDKAFADVYAARAEVNKLIVVAAEKQAAEAQSKADEAAGTAGKAAEDIIRVEGTVSTLKETVAGNTGLIAEEKEIRIQRDAVVTQKLDYLSSEVDMGYADKTKHADKNRSIQWTLATAISAKNWTQNQKIENLQSELNNNSAQIQKELLTLASDDLALASDQSRLSARVGQNSSDILSLSLAVQTPGTGLAAQVTHLQSVTEAAERLAGTKGAIIYSVAEPPAKDRLPQNLWFKKEGENTTPHVWDVAQGKWVALTDKAAATAQAQAKAAKEAAEAAQGVAEAKGEVITSDKIPDATKRMSQNLWIDTRQGKNTPRRWNGSVWEAVTDQAAIDAAKDIKLNLATYVEESGAYSTEFGNISGKITTMQSTVEGVTDSIQVVSAIGDAERLKHEISKERLNKNKAALQGKAADLDTLIAKYKAQRTDAQAKKAQATDATVIASYDSQIALLSTTITDAETQRSEVASQVTQLEQELKELDSLKLTESKVKAQYFIKIDANGNSGGYGLLQDEDARLDFGIISNRFWITSPDNKSKVRPLVYYPSSTTINGVAVPSGLYLDGNLLATGTITGDKIRANTEINAPVIKGGQININDKFIVDSQGNLTGKSGTFEGTVLADKISGTIDVESMKRSAWMGGYTVSMSNTYPSYGIFHENTSHPMFSKTIKIPSYGGLMFTLPEYGGGGAVRAIRFQMEVVAKRAMTVKQYLVNIDDVLFITINGFSGLLGYYFQYSGQTEISYELKEGYNLIEFIVGNGKGQSAITLLGDFIDNVNVKFA